MSCQKCGGEHSTMSHDAHAKKQAEDRQALCELRVWLEHQSEGGKRDAPEAAKRWCGALNRFMDVVEKAYL